MVNTIESRHTAPTREDFLQACKAIHDEVMGSVNLRFKSLVIPQPVVQQGEIDRMVESALGRLLPQIVEAVAGQFVSVLSALPAVTLNTPPMEKTFTYDGMGRPATVTEKVIGGSK